MVLGLRVAQDTSEAADFTAALKGFNPKEIKQNATEIIKAGAGLYDALGQEPELREHRARAVAGHVDTEFVERSIREAIAQVTTVAHNTTKDLHSCTWGRTKCCYWYCNFFGVLFGHNKCALHKPCATSKGLGLHTQGGPWLCNGPD